MGRIPIYILAILFHLSSFAQTPKYIVQFTDKKGSAFTLSSPGAFLSPRAIERRRKQQIGIDSTDLPLSSAYLDSIRKIPQVTIINVSKWLNQAMIATSSTQALSAIQRYPFVKKTEPLGFRMFLEDSLPYFQKFNEKISPVGDREIRSGAFQAATVNGISELDYGNSRGQIRLHEGDYLHNLGFTGKGVVIAILDAGFFGYKTNTAMDSVRSQNRILGEWDFMRNEPSVNEDHPHGLYCLSIIGANKPGQIIGTAPHASFYLFRTEDAATEYPVEEQNWVVAAEYADSAGADLISSSLGYLDFDNPIYNHSYADRNGRTSIVSLGASIATKKGMIVTNSVGNGGNQSGEGKYVICPADAPSVCAVGAIKSTGAIASFSSWGPNSSGATKPDVVAIGEGTVLANTSGNAASGNGTSFSNPLICGLIACLWEAFPEFKAKEILDAVYKSAHLFTTPDSRLGRGIPNFRKAYGYLLQERQNRRDAVLLEKEWIKAFPSPFKSDCRIILKAPRNASAVIQLIDMSGKTVAQAGLQVQEGTIYSVPFNNLQRLQAGVYSVHYNDGSNQRTLRIIKQ